MLGNYSILIRLIIVICLIDRHNRHICMYAFKHSRFYLIIYIKLDYRYEGVMK